MNEVLQTNVFFVITSIAVVLLTILVSVALFYLIRILRNVRDITDRLKRGSEQLAEDALAMRSFVHEGIIGTIRLFFSRSTKTAARPSKKARADDEREK